MATWHTLTSEKQYKLALRRINALIDLTRTEAVENELTLLAYLIEEYEDAVHPMPDATPDEVIRFAMEMKGIKQKELIPVLGSKSQVSKILHGSRNLRVEKIRQLSAFLGIPPEALLPKDTSRILNQKKTGRPQSLR